MGSESDKAVMQDAVGVLKEAGITSEVLVMSAHRTPDKVAKFAKGAKPRGIKVIIAGAGLAAALPGMIAAYTDLPVIGVPIATGTLGGLDALLSIAQMPKGVPVAAVGVNNAKNAGLLALRILAS
jgi:phosphoribosylaminoimidazole carboxylase PurE protein